MDEVSEIPINFGFALVNEEMIYQAVQLAKTKDTSNLTLTQYQQLGEELATKVFIPQLIIQLDKITARKPVRAVKDYHSAEVSFVKKAKQMISLVKMIKISEKVGQEANYKQAALKALNIFKNTTADEIRVGKDKLKKYAGWLVDMKGGAELQKYPELRQFMQSLMNFLDAVGDEELLQEGLSLCTEIAENIVHRIDDDEKD
ncbi:6115_t:CDS:2 [Gigaspora margarita]|uniref:6115_t:CDS:1 n=1 Tax=Gigaspora margarita TaxID=4874 RepID=A0ABN7UDF9_GIGMA|nr:6115_t:CDS:2 [Gigaspora margarita]